MNEAGRVREIALGARVVPYTVRRSGRAQRLRLRVLPHGLEVVLPRGGTLRDAEAFMRQQAAWALRQLDRLPAPAPPLADGVTLPFLGASLRLRLEAGGRADARRVADELRVTAPLGADLMAVVVGWYRAEARRYFTARVAAHAARLGVTPGRIAIKDTRSRWGSCSSKGNLNFSWRLLLAPDEVADYVAAHEAAHLRELSHAPQFWSALRELCPHLERPRRWLREHGSELTSWG